MSNKRIMGELKKFNESKYDNIFIKPNNDKLNDLSALIIGPADSVFEDSFLFFNIIIPNEYPFKPPIFNFLSARGTIHRIHPNLYACGKVCLSILGTWSGSEKWSSLLTIEKTLLTISGLLDNDPLYYEPAYGKHKNGWKEYAITSRYLSLILSFKLLKDKENPFYDVMNEYHKNNSHKYLKHIDSLKEYENKNIVSFHNSVTIKLYKLNY